MSAHSASQDDSLSASKPFSPRVDAGQPKFASWPPTFGADDDDDAESCNSAESPIPSPPPEDEDILQRLHLEREARRAADARCAYLTEQLEREKRGKLESLRAKDDRWTARKLEMDAVDEALRAEEVLRAELCAERGAHEATKAMLAASEAEASTLRTELTRQKFASLRAQAQLRSELTDAVLFREAALLKASRAAQECTELLAKVQALEAELVQLRPNKLPKSTPNASNQRSQPAADDPPRPPLPRLNANSYEHYWDLIHTTSAAEVRWRFRLDSFPWPTLTPTNVSANEVARFLRLDSERAEEKRKIVRRQLARWHPDKFEQAKVLELVLEKDRSAVAAQQIEVALSLTTILAEL